MSTRITNCFAQLIANKKKALIPYVMAGDPTIGDTVSCLHALVSGGADMIELGVPFSDPMADGPVIQAAAERALAAQITPAQVLKWVLEFREKDNTTPVILMGYINPFEQMGYAAFAKEAKASGVDAVLVVDLPVEEASLWCEVLRQHELDCIFLLAPTTQSTRMQRICEAASGYLYYVSLKGVTGANTLNLDAVTEKLREIRQHTQIPVVVGFGIKDAETAAAVAHVADGVVVGSALVQALATQNREIIQPLLGGMRNAMDQTR